MARFAYYASADGFRAVRSDAMTYVTGLPGWARVIVGILALPGICLIVLSLLAMLASIATLLLLTVPAYLLLRRLTQWGQTRGQTKHKPDLLQTRSARRVEATVINH